MARLPRLAIRAFCLLSLLACLGTGWLWRQSYRTPPGREYHASMLFARKHTRYTVRSDPGRLRLYGPPPLPAKATLGTPLPGQPPLEELAGQISDQQIQWEVARIWASDRVPSFRSIESPRPRFDTPADTIITEMARGQRPAISTFSVHGFNMHLTGPSAAQVQATLDAVRTILLGDLEEPQRALAAHVILTRLSSLPIVWLGRSGTTDRLDVFPDGTFAQTSDGVRVLLRPERTFSPEHQGNDVETRLCSASLEPAQLAAARDLWHRRMDVPVRSVPDWLIVAVTGMPPLVWFGAVLRRAWLRKRRQRRGLCRRCGYDLTGNISGKCSECGQPTGREVPA